MVGLLGSSSVYTVNTIIALSHMHQIQPNIRHSGFMGQRLPNLICARIFNLSVISDSK